MVRQLPDDLKESFDSLINAIYNSKDYQDYLKLKTKMEKNEEIKKLVSDIKKLQKDIVKKEYMKETCEDIEKEYQQKLKNLYEYPLYSAFQEKQKAVNEILQTVKIEIQDFFDVLLVF